MAPIIVSGLNLAHLKSAKLLPQQTVQLGARGIIGDREFMVVDKHGKFVTMRELPILTLVTLLPHDSGAGFTLAAPGMNTLTVDYDPISAPREPVTVWNATVQAEFMGAEAAAWLSNFTELHGVGDVYRIFRFGAEAERKDKKDPRFDVAFHDGAQLLMISESSLADHNERRLVAGLPPTTMARLRPSIVVSASGLFPHMEDAWQEIRIGDITLSRRGLCFRCRITDTDENTGQYLGPAGLALLASYRRFDLSDYGYGKGAAFGTYYGITSMPELSQISVGDQVRIIR